MKKQLLALLVLFISFNVAAQPKPFWNEIKAFRTQDSIQQPKDGMILFIGSSSFRFWKTAKEDFNNTNIVNRAFGGATLEDLIYWQNDVVLKYKPKKIFIYCGENDIASSEKVTPQIVFERYKTLHTTLRKTLISHYLKQDNKAVFVNIWDKMLENGEPIKDIFVQDNLHMNSKGYAIWTKELYPLVNE